MDKARLAELTKMLREEYDRLNADRFGSALGAYKLRFSGYSARTHGRINFSKREIMISWPMYEQYGWEAVLQTLLHEMTHALIRERGGHDRHTKLFWAELSARGGGRARYDVKPAKAHVYACPTCGREFERMKRLKNPGRYSCVKCDRSYNPRHRLYLKGQRNAAETRPGR